MQNLIHKKHPKIDAVWPKIEKLAYKLCYRLASKRHADPEAMMGQAYVVANHLLFKYKKRQAKFSTFFMFCGERLLDATWVMWESEHNHYKMLAARAGRPAEAEFVPVRETHRVEYREAEITPEREIVLDCGGDIWEYARKVLTKEQWKVMIHYYRDRLRREQVASKLKITAKRVNFLTRLVRERMRKRLMSDIPSARAYA